MKDDLFQEKFGRLVLGYHGYYYAISSSPHRGIVFRFYPTGRVLMTFDIQLQENQTKPDERFGAWSRLGSRYYGTNLGYFRINNKTEITMVFRNRWNRINRWKGTISADGQTIDFLGRIKTKLTEDAAVEMASIWERLFYFGWFNVFHEVALYAVMFVMVCTLLIFFGLEPGSVSISKKLMATRILFIFGILASFVIGFFMKCMSFQVINKHQQTSEKEVEEYSNIPIANHPDIWI